MKIVINPKMIKIAATNLRSLIPTRAQLANEVEELKDHFEKTGGNQTALQMYLAQRYGSKVLPWLGQVAMLSQTATHQLGAIVEEANETLPTLAHGLQQLQEEGLLDFLQKKGGPNKELQQELTRLGYQVGQELEEGGTSPTVEFLKKQVAETKKISAVKAAMDFLRDNGHLKTAQSMFPSYEEFNSYVERLGAGLTHNDPAVVEEAKRVCLMQMAELSGEKVQQVTTEPDILDLLALFQKGLS